MNKTTLLVFLAGYALLNKKKSALSGALEDAWESAKKAEEQRKSEAIDTVNKLFDQAGQGAYASQLEARSVWPDRLTIERESGVVIPADAYAVIANEFAKAKPTAGEIHAEPIRYEADSDAYRPAWPVASPVQELRVRGGRKTYPNLEAEAAQSSGWGETTTNQIAAYHRRLAQIRRSQMADAARKYAPPKAATPPTYAPAAYPTRIAKGGSSGMRIDPTFLRR